ncbi:charged multivesicular body protein 1b-like [Paramisgurnus dabryanus]|uniref:charged multivesicular body protein 1b-like n=1 Tax=Paramisgurnus dabryanus TaxID=90735 RepID=UPI0031F37EB9
MSLKLIQKMQMTKLIDHLCQCSKCGNKVAIQKGNMEVAQIHAETAIRQKNHILKLTMQVTKSIAEVVKEMDPTLKSMNLEKAYSISKICVFRLDLNMELPQGQTGSVGTSVASAEQQL